MTFPEDPNGPCVPCRKTGLSDTCKGRSYPSRKTFQPRGSLDAPIRRAAVTTSSETAPSASIMDNSEFRDEANQIRVHPRRYISADEVR